MLAGEASAALPIFDSTAELRRGLRDYAGMAQVLAFAGVAAEMFGNPSEAADRYYRAGLSARSQDDKANAKAWLNKALSLATRNGLAAIEADARDQLQSLGK